MSEIKPQKTIVYKTVGALQILLDVYLPSASPKAPILLWFHGGGLLQGRRDQLAAHMRRAVQQYGLAVISADYRLAPQVGIPEIFQDVQDCITFIRKELVSHLDDKGAVDVSRLAVSGSSAGGWLALLAGLWTEPKPNVIAPIYPITDPLGTFFTTSQPPPMNMPQASEKELAPYLDRNAEAVANCGPRGEDPRMMMYVYMMHAANLADLLAVPSAESAELYRVSRNIYKRHLPPAYIVHGDADSAVGVEQSDEVVGAMLGCGLEVKYERIHGKDHFLDVGSDYENVAFYEFILKHLK